ncbi:MAG: NAD(+)/NADH kinase [Clostridiales bacterium]|jgi:NAD+ kinase|nr:NAD(+)/NADH kinase [Clostridiales bacterium]
MNMNRIGIVPNINKPGVYELTRDLVDWLASKDASVRLTPKAAAAMNLPDYAGRRLYAECDLAIVLGGDGTMLRAARHAAPYGTPLLGINLGTLGYLTDADKGEALTTMEKVLAGGYKRERRMMLQGKHRSGPVSGHAGVKVPEDNGCALNDVCVLRKGSNLVLFEVLVNGEYINLYRADGIIIATPTGSTAYNLSAGGPILKPDAEMIVITPICPHTLYMRPLVTSSEDKVTIKCGGTCILAMDGRNRAALSAGDTVMVQKSKHYTNIIKTNAMNFYDVLRIKLGTQ